MNAMASGESVLPMLAKDWASSLDVRESDKEHLVTTGTPKESVKIEIS